MNEREDGVGGREDSASSQHHSHPRVRQDLRQRQALVRFGPQDVLHQIQDLHGQLEAPVQHHLAQAPLGDHAEPVVGLQSDVHGRNTGQHDEQDDAQSPDVAQHGVEAHLALVRQYLCENSIRHDTQTKKTRKYKLRDFMI